MSGQTIALKLEEKCPHCGTPFTVLFRRRLPDGQLEACFVDEIGLTTPWRPIRGFEELVRLPDPDGPMKPSRRPKPNA